MFKEDEIALLQNFTENAAKEDKKLHGVQDKKQSGGFYNQEKSKTIDVKNNNTNKLNQMKPPTQAKKPEPTKPTIQPKVEVKKIEPPKIENKKQLQ